MASHQFDNIDRSDPVRAPSGRLCARPGFRGIAWTSAALILALVVYIIVEIGGKALPAIFEYGLAS